MATNCSKTKCLQQGIAQAVELEALNRQLINAITEFAIKINDP